MRGRCGGCGAVVIMAGVVACDPPDAPIDGGRTEVDAGEVTPMVCVDRGDDTPFVAEVDPATGC